MSSIFESVFRFRWCLIIVTLLAISARMQSITTTMYSFDGYSPDSDNARALAEIVLTQGRWGLAALVRLRGTLGYFGMDVAPSSLIASTLLFTGAGFLYARVLSPKLSDIELFIFVALFTLHPFVTEFYTFSDATLDIAIAIFLAAVGFACASATVRPRLGMVVGCLLMVFALSIYQAPIAHMAVVGLLGVIGWELQLEPASAGPPRVRDFLATGQFRALATVAASAVLYFLSMRLVPRVFDIALDEGAKLSWPPDLAEKANALRTKTAHAGSGLIVAQSARNCHLHPPFSVALLLHGICRGALPANLDRRSGQGVLRVFVLARLLEDHPLEGH